MMMLPIRTKCLTVVIGCLLCVSGAQAGSNCDLVTLSGSGQIHDSTVIGEQHMTIVSTGEVLPITFTAVPLGIVEVDPETGASTSIYSHEFMVKDKPKKTFTTIDEIKIVPFGKDQQCNIEPCGLVFRLKILYGKQHLYTCGEIVSGYDPDPNAEIPYSSYLLGGVTNLNSRGKLCKCEWFTKYEL